MTDSTDLQAVRAQALIDSLPWLRAFQGRIIVVKFGGNAMVDDELKRAFAQDMVYLHHVGIRPVVVHGGGPQISRALAERGISSEFRGGLRVTSPEAMEVVREVLTREVSGELVDLINEHGNLAQALSGETQGLFTGQRRGTIVDGEEVDLGLVGDVVGVDPAVITALLDAGRIPVVSSVAPDGDVPGQVLNVNADSAAASVAVALGAVKLVVLTDVAGLYSDWPNRDSLVSRITASELRALLPSLESGMIPKMTACLEAVDGGVDKAAIIDGRVAHSILTEVFRSSGIGTEVVPDATPHETAPGDETTTAKAE
ncbi:acetylglutamate kinase [Salinibacterium sp. SYSU T00001]|uniref:acetylglutamate kinase n=1 Tax=Homoserinimonas sedimenticola TaxID=2986805 RepID=UPI0022355163|nr:acetylglutamate kinase [Salinibacterium sedimenticola]MCW4386797.1 acetylglutamate kinase [Salinibacterium sedimenticola]